jgi:hypothetical protein
MVLEVSNHLDGAYDNHLQGARLQFADYSYHLTSAIRRLICGTCQSYLTLSSFGRFTFAPLKYTSG